MQMLPGPTLPLREQYPSEYTSWRNLKTRAKKEGVALDNRFVRFPDFLAAMGAKPDPKHTVDRFPQQDGSYTLENVRWADKTTQANNRRNTRRVLHNGEMLPATEVARLTGQVPDTVRKRAARTGTYAKPTRGTDAQISRAAQQAGFASQRLDPFRWVDPDEKAVRFWVSLYQFGEIEWFGNVPAARRFKSLSDGTLRDETFVEFMVRMDTSIVAALTTGDLSELPNVVADFLAGTNYDRQHQLEKSTARLAASHQAWLAAQFAGDPLVDDQAAFACDVSWLDEASAKRNNGILAREAQNRFRRANVQLPERLTHMLSDLSRLPLGRKNTKL